MSNAAKEILFHLINKIWDDWEIQGCPETTIDTLYDYVVSNITTEGDISCIQPNQTRQSVCAALEELDKLQLIRCRDSKIVLKIPYSLICGKIIPELEGFDKTATRDDVCKVIKKYFINSFELICSLLEETDVITFTSDGFSSIISERDKLLDIVLTAIEEADSKQIKYGIYETEQTGWELLANSPVFNDSLRIKTDYAIRELLKEGYLLPLRVSGEVSDWLFRSRIGETVRLLEQLRQRFEKTEIPDATKLVKSIKFEVRDRKYPKRTISIRTAVSKLSELAAESGRFESYNIKKSEGILIEALYSHYKYVSEYQYRSFQTIFSNLLTGESDNSGFVLTAGTGMGKTLSYLVPLLFYCILDRGNKGVKSLNVYPRIKLAENQFASISTLLYKINAKLDTDEKITIGIDYTGTPYKHSDFSKLNGQKPTLFVNGLNRLWGHVYDEGYLCPYFRCPECGEKTLGVKYDPGLNTPLTCSHCGTKINWVQYSKQAQYINPPNILIITTEMLSKHLQTTSAQSLFGDNQFTSPKLIMIDEIHLHTSLKGSHTALLLRRLLQRIRLGHEKGVHHFGSPYVVGLSATIGKPKVFFSELTGISENRIVHEEPQQNELEKNGAEYYIFIKPDKSQDAAIISTLLQTCMCVLHTMPKMKEVTDGVQKNYKALGFVDSIDSVKRWNFDFDNAERNGLFKLRDPGEIVKNKKYQNLAGGGNKYTYNCAACRDHIDTNCPLYKMGECWWFMKYGNEQQCNEKPLIVKFNTAAESVDLDRPYDLLVTTSAMEVGYDDPDIMCVLQYQTPANMASFSQRKGRAGRGLRNRPITITVFNPYNTRDVYYYQNHHYLIDPSFEKPPLNIENQAIKKIHGFYAILDRIAFYAHTSTPINTDSDNGFGSFPGSFALNNSSLIKREIDLLRTYHIDEAYLRKVLGTADKKLISKLSDMYTVLIENLETPGKYKSLKYITPQQMFPQELPKNLISTLNLPAVDICDYYPTNEIAKGNAQWLKHKKGRHCPFDEEDTEQILSLHTNGRCNKNVVETYFSKCEKDFPACTLNYLDSEVDINLGLSNNFVGKATLRYEGASYWIPPKFEESKAINQYNIDTHYLQLDANKNNPEYNSEISYESIPNSLKAFIPNAAEKADSLLVYRPDLVRLKLFQENGSELSEWIYSDEEDSVTSRSEIKECSNASKNALTDKSKSYPVSFYAVRLEEINNENTIPERPSEYVDESLFTTGYRYGPFDKILTDVKFANVETGEYINAKRAIVGGNGSLYFWNGKHDPVPLKFGLNHTTEIKFGEKQYEDVALGYELHTEGACFTLNAEFLEDTLPRLIMEDEVLYFDILNNFFKEKVFLENRGPKGFSSFTLAAFLENYLHLYQQERYTSSTLRLICNEKGKREAFAAKIKSSNESLHLSNSFAMKDLESILEDPIKSKDFLNCIADAQESILEQKDLELIKGLIIDTFIHSFKHALKSTCIALGGFEQDRDVNGWCEMSYDFEKRNYTIYLFEQGMYGNGGFRTIYQKYKKSPLNLWNQLLSSVAHCQTSHDEVLVRKLLSNPDEICSEIASSVQEILSVSGTAQKELLINKLMSDVRKRCNLLVTPADYPEIIRIFSPPIVNNDGTISNWKLYKELNVKVWNCLFDKYRHTPTTLEIVEYCSSHIDNSDDLHEWKALKDLLQKTGGEETGSKRLNVELEKRLLNSCVDGCPSCLHISCDLDSDPQSKNLLLSRRMLQKVVEYLKHSLVVTDLPEEELKDAVLSRLKTQYNVYLKYSDNDFRAISKLIADITNWHCTINGKKYLCYVYSDVYVETDFKSDKSVYELCLSLLEVTL